MKSIRRLRDKILRKRIRVDVLIVAVAILVASGVIFITPSKTTSVILPGGFTNSSKADWFYAGYLYIPAGDSLSANFVSNTVMTVGFASQSSWDNFTGGNISAPSFLASATGTSGSFAFHAGSSTVNFVLVAHFNPNNIDFYKVVLTASDYYALRPYAYMVFWVGIILLGTSLTYERLKRLASSSRRF